MATRQLFDEVFDKTSIYSMLFFNVKSVLIYPTLKDLEEKNKPMFERWKYLSKAKYNFDMNVTHAVAGTMIDETPQYAQKTYEENAVQHPEFNKVIAVTYALVYNENNTLKRHLKKIVSNEEQTVVEEFANILYGISSEAMHSTPHTFPTICGHNIIGHDIPLFIKRFLYHRNQFQSKNMPYILKRALNIKPWESGIIDTVNVWKFNGFDYSSLMLISDFLGLKKDVDLLTHVELSKYYWENIDSKPQETLEFIARQSATQTNLVIQLMNELRQV